MAAAAAGASREAGGVPDSMEEAAAAAADDGAQQEEEVEIFTTGTIITVYEQSRKKLLRSPNVENCLSELQEQLVVVELSGIIDSDFLEKCDNKCKILGIDTERPILQIDRYVFAGEYEDTLGTCVVFEENHDHDVEGNQKLQLKYKCHTMKKLNMTRTLLVEKKEGEENIGGGIEWLDLQDKDDSYSRPNMICNFLYDEKDDETAEPQDKLAEESEEEASDKGNMDWNLEPGISADIAKDDAEPLLDASDPIIENPSIENSQNTASEEPPH